MVDLEEMVLLVLPSQIAGPSLMAWAYAAVTGGLPPLGCHDLTYNQKPSQWLMAATTTETELLCLLLVLSFLPLL